MSDLKDQSRARWWLCSLLLATLAGCGGSAAVKVDVASQSLDTVLTAWKSGDTATSLEQQSPKIIAGDFDWRAGKKLVDFKIRDEGAAEGGNLRKSAELTLQADSGPATRVVAEYLITTDPVITVVRQETE